MQATTALSISSTANTEYGPVPPVSHSSIMNRTQYFLYRVSELPGYTSIMSTVEYGTRNAKIRSMGITDWPETSVHHITFSREGQKRSNAQYETVMLINKYQVRTYYTGGGASRFGPRKVDRCA